MEYLIGTRRVVGMANSDNLLSTVLIRKSLTLPKQASSARNTGFQTCPTCRIADSQPAMRRSKDARTIA
jgi:hypothetical protein